MLGQFLWVQLLRSTLWKVVEVPLESRPGLPSGYWAINPISQHKSPTSEAASRRGALKVCFLRGTSRPGYLLSCIPFGGTSLKTLLRKNSVGKNPNGGKRVYALRGMI
ncbi:unnamed protein product [Cuscuta europaea]|uniref:Secreted protein n=1 Tax=Cuscuta europaea TaxID=41803 RepID=A0A9P0YZT8_CUSEU|nr:unnamed protein product [Cuscuta europaea]